MGILRLWFLFGSTVTRKQYLLTGIALMALKLAIDDGIAFAATGHTWPPLAYLAPSWKLKSEAIPAPSWMLATMAIVALPFLWVGLSMSVRRAADAGMGPFTGFLFVVPGFNYLLMLILAVAPSAKKGTRWVPPDPNGPYRTPDAAPPPPSAPKPIDPAVRATMLGFLGSVGLGLAMIAISVNAMQLYGGALFFGTPVAMGATTAFFFNQHRPRGLPATIGLAVLCIVVTGSAVLLFAIEGLLCLLMAAPIAIVLAIVGAIIGWAIARHTTARPVAARWMLMLGALPGFAGAEAKTATPNLHAVVTTIEIDAPPEKVWPNVIGFSELPPPPEPYFQLGIAYPMRARIEGEGVGAVRRCEFSTGPFVEPITAWEPPRRLAFDVASQPPSMTELSPYKDVRAAHLEGYMVSRRGEFRLVPLPGNRTRLEGTTWYTLALYPEEYWTVFGEMLLHSIHGRVLGHIKQLSQKVN